MGQKVRGSDDPVIVSPVVYLFICNVLNILEKFIRLILLVLSHRSHIQTISLNPNEGILEGFI